MSLSVDGQEETPVQAFARKMPPKGEIVVDEQTGWTCGSDMGRARYVTAPAGAMQFCGVFFVSGCLLHPIGGFAADKICMYYIFWGLLRVWRLHVVASFDRLPVLPRIWRFCLWKSLKNTASVPKMASQTQNAVKSAGRVNIDAQLRITGMKCLLFNNCLGTVEWVAQLTNGKIWLKYYYSLIMYGFILADSLRSLWHN